MLHRVLVNAKKLGNFGDRVVAVNFDPPRVDLALRHRSFRPRLDQAANVFYAPSRGAGAKFDRLGEAPGFDASPPRRFADRDWAARGENRCEADEASFG